MAAAGRSRFVTVRQGVALVYVAITLPAMLLIASLAVDYGRVQAAKTQLQLVVDASALAGAQDLANYQPNSTAQATAIAVAVANRLEGKPVIVQASEVVFGTWDLASSTFTPNTSTTNAIQVTACLSAANGNAIPVLFMSAFGSATTDVTATATVYISQEMAPFNALGDVVFNHTGLANGAQWHSDSYINNLSPYSSTSSRLNGNLVTNGMVSYNFVTPAGAAGGWDNRISNYMGGTIYTASGANVTQTWVNNGVPGAWIEYGGYNNPGPSTQMLSSAVSFPTPTMPSNTTNPTVPGTYLATTPGAVLPNLVVSNGQTVHLPAGTYCFKSVSVSNGSTVVFDGPVTLNIANSLTIDGGAMIPSANDPKRLAINLCNTDAPGANTITIKNLSQDLYTDINGPKADLDFTQPDGGYSLYGRVIANKMTFNCTGNGGIHGDESLLTAYRLVK